MRELKLFVVLADVEGMGRIEGFVIFAYIAYSKEAVREQFVKDLMQGYDEQGKLLLEPLMDEEYAKEVVDGCEIHETKPENLTREMYQIRGEGYKLLGGKKNGPETRKK